MATYRRLDDLDRAMQMFSDGEHRWTLTQAHGGDIGVRLAHARTTSREFVIPFTATPDQIANILEAHFLALSVEAETYHRPDAEYAL